MLPERTDIGRALTKDEEIRLLATCRRSNSRSLYTAVVVFSNTGLRNKELRVARWCQVDFLKAEFRVGKSKTAGGEGRIVPLNKAALSALQDWRARWPGAQPEEYIFPTEKLAYANPEAFVQGTMTPYATDRTKPLGSWKRAWSTAKKLAKVECRMHDLRHSFVSKLAETQTTDATILALSGHLSRKMLEHYSHIRVEANAKPLIYSMSR